jgi:Ca-activated chloride channel family protein
VDEGQCHEGRHSNARLCRRAALHGGLWDSKWRTKLRRENFDKHDVNRNLVFTDGDFNVGLTDEESLIEQKRKAGSFLSLLGFGMGNYHDSNMQAMSNYSNAVASYIDSLEEAHIVMVTEAQSKVFPIAKNVKLQVEFNPASVAEYRLIGYEKRILKR